MPILRLVEWHPCAIAKSTSQTANLKKDKQIDQSNDASFPMREFNKNLRMTNVMDQLLRQFATTPRIRNQTERRVKPRVSVTCRVLVRGKFNHGKRSQEIGMLRDLSASGLYVRVLHPYQPGDELTVVFPLTPPASNPTEKPAIVVHGIVVRRELESDGASGLGLGLKHHRLI